MAATTMAGRIRVEVGADSDNDIDQDAQGALKIVGLSVSQERTDDENGEDQSHRVEDFEMHVHTNVQSPASDDDQWGIEQSGLDGSAKNMSKSQVHLVVPSLVDGCKMF